MYFSMTKTIYSFDTTSFKLGQLLMVRKWLSTNIFMMDLYISPTSFI